MSKKKYDKQEKFDELNTLNKLNRIPNGRKSQMALLFAESLRKKINEDKK